MGRNQHTGAGSLFAFIIPRGRVLPPAAGSPASPPACPRFLGSLGPGPSPGCPGPLGDRAGSAGAPPALPRGAWKWPLKVEEELDLLGLSRTGRRSPWAVGWIWDHLKLGIQAMA